MIKVVMLCILALLVGCKRKPLPAEETHSADWIAAIPDSEMKRKFIVGCAACHQIGPPVAIKQSEEQWRETIKKMKKMDDELELKLIPFDVDLATWLAQYSNWPTRSTAVQTSPITTKEHSIGKEIPEEIRPGTDGFYHDVAVAGGWVWVADYFGNVLYGLNPKTGESAQYDIPVDRPAGKPGGAHAMDVDAKGSLWITFTKAEQVARFDVATRTFKMFSGFPQGGNVQYFVLDANREIYTDDSGGVWVNHFSKEMLSRLDPETGAIQSFPMKRTESLPEGGVHLYAVVADAHGILWYTETHGNRLGFFDPKTLQNEEWDLFVPWAGPKRLAIDPEGQLWIPLLATGQVVIYDTKTRKITDTLQLPVRGDYPYAIRRNKFTGDLWVTGSGSDMLYRLDPKTRAFTVFKLPQRGAYTRTVAFEEDGTVWTNYSSFPNHHTTLPTRRGSVVELHVP